jgi:hypothetical protein
MRSLGILFAAAALALACERAQQVSDTAVDQTQTFSEAAGELASDVAADVSAAAEDTAARERTDAVEGTVE